MERLRLLIADGQAWLARLNSREKRLLMAAGAAVVAFVFFLVIIGFAHGAARTRERTEKKLAKLGEAQALAAIYRDAEQSRQGLERQLSQSDVRLLTYLTEKSSDIGLDTPPMNPKGDVAVGDGRIMKSSVELTLTDVPLRKLVDFLSNVERGPGVVKVEHLSIEPRVLEKTVTARATIGSR